MNLPQTGVLDINWSATTGVSGYKIDVLKNGLPESKIFIADSGVSNASFTGFAEGQSGDAIVYTYQSIRSHKVYSETGIHTESTFFNPENFNVTSGQSFNFTGIKVNNISLDSTLYTGNIHEADASFELPAAPNDGVDFNFSDPKPKIVGLNTTSKVTSGQFYEVDRVRFTSSTGTATSIRINGTDNLNIAFRGVNWEMTSIVQSGGLFATGTTSSNSLDISYKLISPRSGDLISNYQDFEDEPFAKSITGYFYDSSGYYFSLPNILSNKITHQYTGISRNFYLHLEALDFYSGSATGVIKFENELPSVIDLASTEATVSGSGSLSFFPSYSRGVTGVHAFLYSDSSLSTLDQSIASTNTSKFNFSIPLDSDRYIKVIPYSSFGSGNHFTDQVNYGIISREAPKINTNKISLLKTVLFSGERFANVYCYTDLNSYSGYHLDISIYTGINNASNQYFSGSFNEDVNYLFDITGSRSGQEEAFNVDCFLYESGNPTFLDSGSMFFSAPYPSIISTGIEEVNILERQDFDYVWNTNITDFDSYLTFLVSHDNLPQTTYDAKEISVSITGGRTQVLNVSLVDKDNTGVVFDSKSITGVSSPPIITGISNVNERFFAPKFDQFLFSPFISTNLNSISGYEVYEKKSLSHAGDLSLLKTSVDSYPLDSNHLIQELSDEQYINIPSPESAEPQSTGNYISGSLGTGYYNSGNIFNYKIVPYDYIGSGNPFSFDVEHGIANVTKVIRQDTDATIVNVTNVTSEVSNVGTDLSGVSGDVSTVSVNLSGVSGTVDTVNSNLSSVSGTVDTVNANLSTVSGTVDSVNLDLNTVSGRTDVLPTGEQVLSGSLNVTGDSHISGDLNVGRSEDNVLFSVHGTGSFINSNLSVSGRLAVSGRMTLGGDPPTSSTNTGIFGQIAFDSQYFYVCTGTNKWGRVELSNW